MGHFGGFVRTNLIIAIVFTIQVTASNTTQRPECKIVRDELNSRHITVSGCNAPFAVSTDTPTDYSIASELTLTLNEIPTLKRADLSPFTAVKSLRLIDNQINEIEKPEDFPFKPNLESLEIRQKNMFVYDSQASLKSLKNLTLEMGFASSKLWNKEQLVSLTITKTKISNTSDVDIIIYYSLSRLVLQECSLTRVNLNIDEESHLTHLDLSGNAIGSDPEKEQKFGQESHTEKLRVMLLNDNRDFNITNIDFTSLKTLKELFLRGNGIQYIKSDKFYNCRDLEFIDLSRNHLKQIDIILKGPKLVKKLVVDDNVFDCGFLHHTKAYGVFEYKHTTVQPNVKNLSCVEYVAMAAVLGDNNTMWYFITSGAFFFGLIGMLIINRLGFCRGKEDEDEYEDEEEDDDEEADEAEDGDENDDVFEEDKITSQQRH